MAGLSRKCQIGGKVNFVVVDNIRDTLTETDSALLGYRHGNRHLTGIVFYLNQRRQDMDCPICGTIAERVAATSDSVGVACPMCGEFDIASSVIATGQLRRLALQERADVLWRAQRSAEPGARPMITPYLLA
jgi:predicted RNA-binding Zn-ribbon protein involved in translation (DUF1610 family)